MMGIDGGVMLVAMLVCALALPLVLLGAVYLAFRALGSSGRLARSADGRALLERRLAAGEIDVEEYYERESALRSADPGFSSRDSRWRRPRR